MSLRGLSVSETTYLKLKALAETRQTSLTRVTEALLAHALFSVGNGDILDIKPMAKYLPKPVKTVVVSDSVGETVVAMVPVESAPTAEPESEPVSEADARKPKRKAKKTKLVAVADEV